MTTLFHLYFNQSSIMARTAGSKNFTPEINDLVMRKRKQGEGISQIARSLCMSRAAVSAIVKREGKKTPQPGRTPSISPRLSRRIAREARTRPEVYSTELTKEICPHVTPQTVRRMLRKAGLKSRVAIRKPALTRVQIANRLKFAKEHVDKPLSFWHRVLWSDESKILSRPDPRRKVWRPDGQALKPQFVAGTHKSGQASIMVWGCCSAAGVGRLHHIDTKMNSQTFIEVLEQNLQASRRSLRLPRDWLFMQDNDPKHTSKLTRAWLQSQGVEMLRWPANSPDLNPIEHLWGHLKREFSGPGRVRRREIFARVKEVWDQIPPEVVRRLVDSMPRRLAAVLKARGGHTKY